VWQREIMLERQREGIAKAKPPGKYKRHPVSINAAQIKQPRAELGPAANARRLGIAQRSAARVGNGSEPRRAREIATYCRGPIFGLNFQKKVELSHPRQGCGSIIRRLMTDRPHRANPATTPVTDCSEPKSYRISLAYPISHPFDALVV
jgi:hypothetical protein